MPCSLAFLAVEGDQAREGQHNRPLWKIVMLLTHGRDRSISDCTSYDVTTADHIPAF